MPQSEQMNPCRMPFCSNAGQVPCVWLGYEAGSMRVATYMLPCAIYANGQFAAHMLGPFPCGRLLSQA